VGVELVELDVDHVDAHLAVIVVVVEVEGDDGLVRVESILEAQLADLAETDGDHLNQGEDGGAKKVDLLEVGVPLHSRTRGTQDLPRSQVEVRRSGTRGSGSDHGRVDSRTSGRGLALLGSGRGRGQAIGHFEIRRSRSLNRGIRVEGGQG
jgi:hypothetical protein